MPLRSILVHLTSHPRSEVRLRLATELARRVGARLTGLFAQTSAAHQVGINSVWPTEEYKEAGAAARAVFAAATEGLETDFQDLNRGAEADLVPQMLDYSRHFDLSVLGQRKPDNSHLLPPDLAEQIIVHSGRPALVVPFVGQFATLGARPVFAWSDSRCAARALLDAIPLATPDAEALVVSLSKPGDDAALAYRKQSLALAAGQLAVHGVKAQQEQLTLGEIGLMDALLNRVADHGGDLLAMGAFGGGGYPLFSRGSGSRYLLKHMTMPVLLSH
jgi:nucleotide-binding universal stress UspA family protein